MSGIREEIWSWLEEHGGVDSDHVVCPCYKCRFWEPWPEDAQDLGMNGFCTRNPPQGIWNGVEIIWQQPETGCLATCGEWKKRGL